MKRTWLLLLKATVIGAVVAGCISPTQQATATPRAAAATAGIDPTATAATVTPAATPCTLPTIIPPTALANPPGYAELDPVTGLHVTGQAPAVDLDSYRLVITGKVERPLALTFDDLRCMPHQTVTCTLVCPGLFEDTGSWGGASFSDVLGMAGILPEATYLRLISADDYSTFVSLTAAQSRRNLLAYEWEGELLPVLHGFPVRAVFPYLEGNRWAKWLVRIEVD